MTQTSEGRGQDSAVVVGVDSSPGSVGALRWAAEEARARSLPLRAVVAWHVALAPTPMGRPPAATPSTEQHVHDAQELLARTVREALGDDADVEVEVVHGPAAKVLVDQSHHAQHVVVGSRGLGGFAGVLLGSVSQHLVHHAHCPVTVVPLEWSAQAGDQPAS